MQKWLWRVWDRFTRWLQKQKSYWRRHWNRRQFYEPMYRTTALCRTDEWPWLFRQHPTWADERWFAVEECLPWGGCWRSIGVLRQAVWVWRAPRGRSLWPRRRSVPVR